MKNPCSIGLEWTDAGVTFSRAEKKRGEWTLAETSFLVFDPHSHSSALKDFVAASKMKGATVHLALPRSELILQWSELPAGAALEFPFPPEQVIWTHQIMPLEKGRSAVCIAGLARARAAYFRETLAAAGLRLGGIGFNANAQLAALNLKKPFKPDDSILLIDSAASTTQITFGDKAGARFCRSVPFGRDDGVELEREIEKTQKFYVESKGGRKPNVEIRITDDRWLASFGQAVSPFLKDPMWLIAPKSPHSRMGDIVVGLSVLLVAFGLLLVRAEARNKTKMRAARSAAAKPMSLTQQDMAIPVLADVIAGLPTGVYLLDYNFDSAQRTLFFRGRSADYAKVSELVSGLSKSRLFRNVRGEKADLIQIHERQIVEFSVGADISDDLSSKNEPVVLPMNGLKSGFEGLISESAKSAGIKRLLSVGTKEIAGSKEIHLEWDADQSCTFRFLSDLKTKGLVGPCLKLQLSGSDNQARLVHATGIFQPPSPRQSSSRGPGVPPMHDAFMPLWTVQPTPVETKRSKKQEETEKREQERLSQERKVREESERLNAKRRQLESLTVAGIAHNGREALAFVMSGAGGATTTVRTGDSIEEARVTSIDENRGEVRLDYAGAFQVVLKLNSSTRKFP